MAGAKTLVMGASGFLGSHVTRQLVERGDDVRVILRQTSSTKAIEGFYCVVDIWPRLDRGKAERELGWRPKPVYESVRAAAQFFRENRRRRH